MSKVINEDDVINIELPSVSRDIKRIKKRLRHNVGEAIVQYGMIEQGDRIMVCMSGGKDSYTMLNMLLELQKKAPIDFESIEIVDKF